MCRSIKVLRRPEETATPDEIAAASLQFVRKVSGFRAPSKMNQQAFDSAVEEIAGVTARLLSDLKRGAAKNGTVMVSTATDDLSGRL